MHRCCTDGDPAPSARAWPRRAAALFQWTLPIAALTLVPKCPACVAAYVLLFTGIGLSIPVAATIRWALILSGIAALVFLLARRAMAMVKHGRT